MGTKKMTQSQRIRAMYTKGSTKGEIAKKLGIRYQIVWRTIDRGLGGEPIPQNPKVTPVETVTEPVPTE